MGELPDMPFITMYTFPGKAEAIASPQLEKELREWVIINNAGKEKRCTIKRNDWPTVRRKKIDVDR
jgi:hypothetical protein